MTAVDAPTNRKFLAMLLQKKGVQLIDFAADGQEAVDLVLAQQRHYDVIFMDNTMPKMVLYLVSNQ